MNRRSLIQTVLAAALVALLALGFFRSAMPSVRGERAILVYAAILAVVLLAIVGAILVMRADENRR